MKIIFTAIVLLIMGGLIGWGVNCFTALWHYDFKFYDCESGKLLLKNVEDDLNSIPGLQERVWDRFNYYKSTGKI